MGKGRARKQKKTVESESRILLYAIRRDVARKCYGELYTIDVEKDEVKKCPHALYKDFGISSVAALGSVIYVFGGHHPEIVRMHLIPDDDDDELRKNPNLHCYAGYSCLDLNDDSGSGWKPAPPFKVIPIDQYLNHFISLCGKIYAIGYNDAEVFDPRCNDWNRVFPPPGFVNFNNLSKPVVADPLKKRMFLHFQSGNKFPLYAYYPDDADNSGRWELLVEDFKLWSPGGVAFADGVLYFYVEKSRDVIGAAFDVETKQWLNINFSSKFDFETIMKSFIAFLHLGNGVLCLASYYIKQFKTYVEVVKFRVRRTSSVNVLFTPISFRRHTIPTICAVSNVIPLRLTNMNYQIEQLKNTMDVRQQLLQASKSKSSSGTPNLEMKSSKFKFNAQVSRGELVNAVILHEYPLAIVDHVGFRRYSGSLNPEFKVSTRNTVKSDILRQFKEERAKKMRELAENESRVAITTDLWTCSNQRKGYMAVTTHYIDNDWVLRDEIIRFIYVPCLHNKESLSKALVKCLKSFNLDEKVSSITFDNCTTNDAVVDVLREKLHSSKLILGSAFLHMRCCAHILNLVVGDGLEYIKDAIEKVRSVVSFCIATPKRYEKFEDACNYCKIPITKKLVLDCKTRWNSCYDMLNVAIMYKDAFTRLDSKVGKRGKDKFQLPSKEEWRMASLICERLALFQRATEAFSGRNYPTANLYFVKVCEINLALRKWSHCGNKVIEEMASKMKDKFDKYWSVINAMLSVASVLDPRKKLECVSFYYRLVYGDSSEVEVDRVKRLLVELVSDYEKVECDDVTPNLVPSSFTNVNNKRPMGEIEDCEGLWERFCLEQPPKKTKKCEVESYLGENRITSDDSKFNLLAWWKHQSHNYPTLSKIVRDILAVPISTVASESAFSTSGRIIGPHRSRLLPDTIEALMCLQSWRRLEFKGEKKNYLECASIYDDEDVELEGHE